MDWDYYGVHGPTSERPVLNQGVQNTKKTIDEGKEVPKRAASTPLEEELNPHSYSTFGLSVVEKRYTLSSRNMSMCQVWGIGPHSHKLYCS